MKLTKETTKNIRHWLGKNNFECTINLGNDFYYNPTNERIVISRNYISTNDYDFIVCLRKLGLLYDFDCITLSVLHELGHFMTENNFTDTQWDKDSEKKEKLSTKYSGSKLNFIYWSCITEKVANLWLVDFVNNNKELVEDLEELISITII